MPGRIARLVLLAMSMLLASCASTREASAVATYVLVRHAEKGSDDAKDPSLSDAGRQRVERLVHRLHGMPLVAVYATAYRRTQQTAAPVAADHGLTVTTYDASMPAAEFAQALRRDHATGAVLVVGHSNTVPAIAQALCGCAIGPTSETEFGRRITVSVRPDGRVTVDDRREP